MLTIKCAACKQKLWKYDKIGHGELLRCHKVRIVQTYRYELREQKVYCRCGKEIAIDKGTFYKMVRKGFVYSGTKRNK